MGPLSLGRNVKRNWKAFRQKVVDEGKCRVCSSTRQLEAAHIIPRSQVSPGPGEDPRNCLPLCGGPSGCHSQYDIADPRTGRTLDLIPYTTSEEASYAVQLVGLERAYRRLVGGRIVQVTDASNPSRVH